MVLIGLVFAGELATDPEQEFAVVEGQGDLNVYITVWATTSFLFPLC
jgi:hypothetical protein